jgi:hypothetical protein
VDCYEGLVEAEEDEGLSEDGTGGEAVGVFVWDYESFSVYFCAVGVCVRFVNYGVEGTGWNSPFEDDLSCVLYLVSWCWPLDGAVFLLD